MRQSENIVDLAGALCKAQAKIEGAVKAVENTHFRSKYADLGAVWDAIREPLTSNGLAVVQLLRGVDRGVECETILMHTTGQFIAETLFMPSGKIDAQGYGSAATYARRFSLMALVGVAPVDDDGEGARGKGGDNDHRDPPPPKPPAPPRTPNVEVDRHFGNAGDEIRSGKNGTPRKLLVAKVGDPKAWAASADAGDFLRDARADHGLIQNGDDFRRWMEANRWEHDAIIEHGGSVTNKAGVSRTEFLNKLIGETQARIGARAPVNLRAAG